MATAGDPVALGYVQSLSRPGGNFTGFSLISGELNQKRLDLLREPSRPRKRRRRVQSGEPYRSCRLGLVKDAGERLGIGAALVELSSPEAILGLRSDALRPDVPVLVVPDVMFWNSRHAIITRLEGSGLCALYPEREYADDGGLMAYGPNVPDNFKRAAGYVDRILKGASPGTFPFNSLHVSIL